MNDYKQRRVQSMISQLEIIRPQVRDLKILLSDDYFGQSDEDIENSDYDYYTENKLNRACESIGVAIEYLGEIE